MKGNALVLLLLSPLLFFMAWDLFSIVRIRFTKFDRSEFFPEWTDNWDPETETFTAKEYIAPPPVKERKQRWWDSM